MADTTYGSISQRTAAWVATEMLKHAEPILCCQKFAQTKPIPKNKADGAKFRRPVPFAVSTVPLVEGVTPTAQALTYEDVPVTLSQYGAVVQITDKVQDMSEDPVLKDASMLCGEQAAETMEILTWNVLRGGSSVFYANGTQRTDVNTALSLNKLQAATRLLKKNRAKVITEMLSGSTDYKTEPVAASFIAFGHTDLEADVRNISGFVPVELYGSAMKALPYEIGKVQNIRFILSPLFTALPNAGGTKGSMIGASSNADVYQLVIVAKDSYALTPLKGGNAMTPMVLPPGTPRGGDPLGQTGTVGWKSYFAALRLNESWLTRLEIAATAL
jgi:N4-gp56 family major capsid protein